MTVSFALTTDWLKQELCQRKEALGKIVSSLVFKRAYIPFAEKWVP
jgi:hypothetical protein